LWAVVFVILLSGCTLFGDELAEEAADVVRKYCEEPLGVRQAVREQVNAAAAPHAVRVTCAGDPQETTSTGAREHATDARDRGAREGEGRRVDVDSADRLAGRGAAPRAGPVGGGLVEAGRVSDRNALPGGIGL